MNKRSIIATLTIFLVLLVDQGIKVWVKTNMYLGQDFKIIGNWFHINFAENNGMAFGMEFAGEYGKLFLTCFRIIAVSGIMYYLVKLIREKQSAGLILAIALIFAGALGNIIDSVFYGVIFNDSYHQVATFMPPGGGYSTWFHGKVVDMLYFPLFSGYFPDQMPIWGGEPFLFFRPVFNIADSAISVGVGLIIVFQRSFFGKPKS